LGNPKERVQRGKKKDREKGKLKGVGDIEIKAGMGNGKNDRPIYLHWLRGERKSTRLKKKRGREDRGSRDSESTSVFKGRPDEGHESEV